MARKTASSITKFWTELLVPKPPAKRKASPPTKLATKVAEPVTPRARLKTPRGASFNQGAHACEFGQRLFMLYEPARATKLADPIPLLVMMHGCGQTAEDFARGTGMNTLADEFGFMVLYPIQSRKAQLKRCWNWFKPSDQQRGQGELGLIANLTQRVIAQQNIDPARVYIAGMSAGGSAALNTAVAYPDIFAAVGAHSGLPVGAAHTAASAVIAMQNGAPGQRHIVEMPTINFHGDADKVVNPRNGRSVAARAAEPYPHLRKTQKVGHVAGGRKYVRTSHRLGTGRSFTEHWVVLGSDHSWSGGNRAGSFTDPSGPDASRQMIQFFLRHRTTKKRRREFRNALSVT